MRFPPLVTGGSWRNRPVNAGGVVVLGAVGLALLVGWVLLGRIALLFQNLYQSTFVLIPGAHIGQDYWRSVDYGLGVAVLIGALSALLLLVAVIEVMRFVSAGRFR